MPVSQTPAKSDGVRPILNSASLVLVERAMVSGCTGYGAGYHGKRTDQKCRQSHLNSDKRKLTGCAHGCQVPQAFHQAAVCLLSSATPSQPHATHSASTHLPGKPQPATSHLAPVRLQSKFSLPFSTSLFSVFPIAVTQPGSASLLGVSAFPLTGIYHTNAFRSHRARLLDSLECEEFRLNHIGYSLPFCFPLMYSG